MTSGSWEEHISLTVVDVIKATSGRQRALKTAEDQTIQQ